MNRAILFDLDDTLFDHRRAMGAAIAAIHAEHGADLPRERFFALHAELLEEVHLETLSGRLDLAAARVERFRRLFARFERPIADDRAAFLGAAYRQHHQANRHPIDGARELLLALRAQGARTAIVSNNLHQEQVEKLAHLGLADLIDLLVTSESAGCAKPQPGIYASALTTLGVPPEAALMVGDNWSADIAGAAACGLKTAWLNRFGAACPDPALGHLTLTALTPAAELAPRLIRHGHGLC